MGRAKGQVSASATTRVSAPMRAKKLVFDEQVKAELETFLGENNARALHLHASLEDNGYTGDIAAYTALLVTTQAGTHIREGSLVHAYYLQEAKARGLDYTDPAEAIKSLLRFEVARIKTQLLAESERSASPHARHAGMQLASNLDQFIHHGHTGLIIESLMVTSGFRQQVGNSFIELDRDIDDAKAIIEKATGQDVSQTPVVITDLDSMSYYDKYMNKALGAYSPYARMVLFNNAAGMSRAYRRKTIVHELIHGQQGEPAHVYNKDDLKQITNKHALLEGATTLYADKLLSKEDDFEAEVVRYAKETAFVKALAQAAKERGRISSVKEGVKMLALASNLSREQVASNMLLGSIDDWTMDELRAVCYDFIMEDEDPSAPTDSKAKHKFLVAKAKAKLQTLYSQ